MDGVLLAKLFVTVFPAVAILLVVLGFNLVGDGLREAFETEV